jgi:arsenite methyltransferase
MKQHKNHDLKGIGTEGQPCDARTTIRLKMEDRMLKCFQISMLLAVIGLSSMPTLAQRNSGCGGRGYREAADQVIRRLALKEGQVIVDVGAGDGWWAKRMADKIGAQGVIHAAEISQKKVDTLKETCTGTPQIKPRLIPLNGTALPEDSCDLAFISKTYHHFDKGGQVDYLRHLKQIIKPNGKLVIIELHSGLATGRGLDHAAMPGPLAQKAEEAGWMLLRYELLRGSDHFMASFVQPESVIKKLARPQTKQKKERSRSQTNR